MVLFSKYFGNLIVIWHMYLVFKKELLSARCWYQTFREKTLKVSHREHQIKNYKLSLGLARAFCLPHRLLGDLIGTYLSNYSQITINLVFFWNYIILLIFKWAVFFIFLYYIKLPLDLARVFCLPHKPFAGLMGAYLSICSQMTIYFLFLLYRYLIFFIL